MLQTLQIRDFALIDHLELDFHQGLNVLSGETGAGKSILIGALNLVLGARASSEIVRDKAKSAKVEAVFRVSRPSKRLQEILREQEIELENDELLLARVVSANGKSKAYAGGNLVPVSLQATIGDELVDLHGQHEHQSLLRKDRQLSLIDAFSDAEIHREKVSKRVSKLREIEKRIKQIEGQDRETARRIHFLRYEADEIARANLEPKEDAELQSRRNLIANSERIFSLSSHLLKLLSDSDGEATILDTLGEAARHLSELAAIDECFAPLLTQLDSVQNEVSAISDDLLAHSEKVEYDPNELDTINGRLSAIRDLQRKYGNTIEDVLEYQTKAITEVEDFENQDARLSELRAERDNVLEEAESAAAALSRKRRSGAKRLDALVERTLHDLGMSGGIFQTRFEHASLSARGTDSVEFLLSANRGSQPKRLRQIASGGEISRVMLAVKAAFAGADAIPTLVFDEIDAGIGGSIATKVANKLSDLSESHQTICITHLAQIAAVADAQYSVSKASIREGTRTDVQLVEGPERVREVARLLDGSLDEVSLNHARALLGEHKRAS